MNVNDKIGRYHSHPVEIVTTESEIDAHKLKADRPMLTMVPSTGNQSTVKKKAIIHTLINIKVNKLHSLSRHVHLKYNAHECPS